MRNMADLAQLYCFKQCPHQWEDRKRGGSERGKGGMEGRRGQKECKESNRDTNVKKGPSF